MKKARAKLRVFLDESLRKLGEYINQTPHRLPLEEFVYYTLCHIRYKYLRNL